MNETSQHVSSEVCIPEGTLVVLSGLPGSGKSHLRANRCVRGDLATWLSSDALRDEITPPQRLLIDGRVRLRRNESANDTVFSILRQRVRAGLDMGRTVVVDATNLTDADRSTWVGIADEVGAGHLVLILDTDLQTCLERADRREVHVPADTIRAMHQPPAPEIDPNVAAKVRRTGAHVASTAPQGFQRTSKFNHAVIGEQTRLVFDWRLLPEGKWDVIGDTHGLFDELKALLAKAGWSVLDGRLQPHPEGRRVLLLADMVDRGTQSIELLRFAKRAMEDGLLLSIKGNHEDKLVRFVRTAVAQGIERWTSYANAETGMKLLKLDPRERDELVDWMNRLPNYYVDKSSQTAFVHGDVHAFEPGVSLANDLVYGMSGWKRMDSDALYQRGVEAGINAFTVVRGHIPATSEQSHIFSLERHPFQRGELVLLRFDGVQPVFADAGSTSEQRQAAFKANLVTQQCEFDFEDYSKKFDLLKGLERLTEEKMVTRQLDDSKMFRVFKYSKQTFWNNSWSHSPLLLKARGLVLDAGGDIVSHPFDKVFNYLENGTGKDLRDDLPVVVTDKLNGFLGIVSVNPLKAGSLLVHTQGGFGGDHVGYITDFITPAVKGQMLRYLARNDVTLLFEVLHKDDPHIVEYSHDMHGLHLIGVRGKRPSDQPWTEAQVDEAATSMGLRRPTWWKMTFGEVRAKLRAVQTEGYMVRADTPQQEFILKLKGSFYLTVKFLGRLSAGRIKHLFSNPADFKKTVDEEFYMVVDTILQRFSLQEFLDFEDSERVTHVRALINSML